MQGTGKRSISSSRSLRAEALAAHVREAAEAAVEAFREGDDERRRIHEIEWGQSNRDTMADIEEVADAMHGFASWVLSGTPHPQTELVRHTLSSFAPKITDLGRYLETILPDSSAVALRHYLGRLEHLRVNLLAYFEETEKSPVPAAAGA